MAGQLATASFDHQHPQAPDNRMQRPNLNARNEISPWIRWEGMQVYVVQEQKTYQLVGGTGNEHWQEIAAGGGASNFVGQFPTFDDLPDSGSPGDYAYVGTGDDFVQYNWDQIAGEWRLNSAETKVSDEDFFLGRVPSEPDRVMFSMRRNSIIYSTGGTQSISPDRMANYVFTGENVTLENVNYSGDGGEEFHITNRTGSNLTILSTGNFASGLTIPAGHMASFKSSDDGWVQSFVNEEATFSDTLDSVNARISRGPDGKDVLSGIFDRNTGGVYNYKKLDSVPAIVDGNIFIGIGADFYKRIFTTPVDLESVGIIYNSEAAATNNTILLARLINMGQPICIKNKLYLSASNQPITATNLTIYGDNDSSEMSFVDSGTLFSYPNEFGDWSIKNIKIKATSSRVFLVQELDVDFTWRELSFSNNVTDGPITFRFRGIDSSPLIASIVNIEVNNNNVKNIPNTFFEYVDAGFFLFEIKDNKVRDFFFNFVYVSFNTSEGYEARKMVIDKNDVVNDTTKTIMSGTSSYFTFILTKCYESVYTNNHVEGMVSIVDKSIHDIYQSSEVSIYQGNTFKNNMAFVSLPTTSGRKALYKAKGGKDIKVFGNKFIIEKSFLIDFLMVNPVSGLNAEDLWVSYMAPDTLENDPARVLFQNNLIDVPYLNNQVMRNKSFTNLVFDNNMVLSERIEHEFIHIKSDLGDGGERFFSFSENIIECDSFGGDGVVRGSNAVNPSPNPSKTIIRFENNKIKNVNSTLFRIIRGVKNLFFSNNNIELVSGVTALFIESDIERISGNNNYFTSNSGLEVYHYSVKSSEADVEYSLILKNTSPPALGLNIFRNNSSYRATRNYSIENPLTGKITIAINIEVTWDGADHTLKYVDYLDYTTYDILYGPDFVLGNGLGSHILYQLRSNDGALYGNIRLRKIGDIAVLCVDFINDGNYTLTYKDSYVR